MAYLIEKIPQFTYTFPFAPLVAGCPDTAVTGIDGSVLGCFGVVASVAFPLFLGLTQTPRQTRIHSRKRPEMKLKVGTGGWFNQWTAGNG